MRYRLGRCLLPALALWTGAPEAGAQERQLVLESFAATLTVDEAGTLDVLEDLRFRFEGSWSGVFRTIPVVYDMGEAGRHRVRLDLVAVRDGSGEPLTYESTRSGAYRTIKIWVPGARDVTRTVVLHYRVREALRFFETHDELYWNVTGNEWEVPIESAVARLVLPGAVTGRRAVAYTGVYGSRGTDARIDQVEEGYYVEASRPLGYKEGLTVAIGWDPGVVHRPGPLERFLAAGGFLLFLPLLSLAGMWRLWHARGRDPDRRPISPRYDPPQGMTPAEVGTLADNSPDMRDFTATIVDLAVRGFIRIEERPPEGLFKVFGKTEFVFHRLLDPSPELKAHEDRLYRALFDGVSRSKVSTDELEQEFYKELGDLKKDVFDSLLAQGDYDRRPDKVLGMHVAIGVAALVLSIGGLVALAAARGYGIAYAIIAGAGVGLPVLGFGLAMPARTVSGTRRLEEILGFEEFLLRVESDRFRRMIKGPEQFEAFLPFAMALAVEDRWAAAFEGLYTEPPSWYVGRYPGDFRPSLFVGSLNSMTQRAGSAMASAPRSSGGSGFGGGGGGGFSGGGFGGGGGGGF